jgi:hypothetical protein
LYKQKDLKLNLSRVSGVKTLFKIAIWWRLQSWSDLLNSMFFQTVYLADLGCASEKSDLCILYRLCLADWCVLYQLCLSRYLPKVLTWVTTCARIGLIFLW